MIDYSKHSILVDEIKLFERAYFFSNYWQYLFQVIDTQTLKNFFDNNDCQRLVDKRFLGMMKMAIFLLNTQIAQKCYQFAYFFKVSICLNSLDRLPWLEWAQFLFIFPKSCWALWFPHLNQVSRIRAGFLFTQYFGFLVMRTSLENSSGISKTRIGLGPFFI